MIGASVNLNTSSYIPGRNPAEKMKQLYCNVVPFTYERLSYKSWLS
jgi:hypothetical protein